MAAGVVLRTLTLVDDYADGARLYHASTPQGDLDVHVFDRDTFGLASGRRVLDRLRLRGATTRGPALTLRAALEHRSLQALALGWAGVLAPRPVAVCEVDGASAVIAMTRVNGVTLRELGPTLAEEQARAVLRLLTALQDHRIAFRGLDRDNVVLRNDGQAGLRSVGDGDVGGDDISRRSDGAQVLVMLAPVSYTHLDPAVAVLGRRRRSAVVAGRHRHRPAGPLPRLATHPGVAHRRGGGVARGAHQDRDPGGPAVSYTHLDVYKRQVVNE